MRAVNASESSQWKTRIAIEGGFAEVNDKGLTVLAETVAG